MASLDLDSDDDDDDGRGRRRRRAPRNTRAWNDDLIAAMEARMHSYRARGMRKWFNYRDAAALLRTVRDDIYRGATGQRRFYNLPRDLKPEFVRRECEDIMRGDVDVLPRRMEDHQPGGSGFVPEGEHEHPYLSRMQPFQGGYAILMAFRAAGRGALTKHEILRHAKKYSQVEMAANFHAGRLRAGWDSMKSLETHGLVVRRGGLNSRMSGRCDTFVLTDEGSRFTSKMIEKFGVTPGVNDVVVAASVAPSTPLAVRRSGFSSPAMIRPTPSGNTTLQGKQIEAERRLRDWVKTGEREPGDVLTLEEPKHVRRHLHQVCDHLRTEGYDLKHESAGDGRARTLLVTFEGWIENISSSPVVQAGSSQAKRRISALDSPDGSKKRPRREDWDTSPSFEETLGNNSFLTSSREPSSLSGGQCLGGQSLGTPLPRDAAALAAMRRLESSSQHPHATDITQSLSNIMNSDRKKKCVPSNEISSPGMVATVAASCVASDPKEMPVSASGSSAHHDEDLELALALSASVEASSASNYYGDRAAKPHAARALEFTAHKNRQSDRMRESVDEDFDRAIALSLQEECSSPIPSSRSSVARYSVRSPASLPSSSSGTVVIHVDNREKRKNDDPRGVMNKVKEKVMFKGPGWPRGLAVEVDQIGLATGDFCFGISTTNREEYDHFAMGDMLIERKTLSDLAGRLSHRHGNAHYVQCRRMLSSGVPLPCLLIEGDLAAALLAGEQGHTVYDADEMAGETGTLDLFGEIARILLHFEGRVRLLLSPGLSESADMIQSFALLVGPLSPNMSLPDFMGTKGSSTTSGTYVTGQKELIDALSGLSGVDAISKRFISLLELKQAYRRCGKSQEAALRLLEPIGLSTKESREVWMATCGNVPTVAEVGTPRNLPCASITCTSSAWCAELNGLFEAKRIAARALYSGEALAAGGCSKRHRSRPEVEEATIFVSSASSSGSSRGSMRSITFRILAVDSSKIAEVVKESFDPDKDDIQNAMFAAACFVSKVPSRPKDMRNENCCGTNGKGPVLKEILCIERLGSQVTALNRWCAQKGSHNGRLLLERAHSIMSVAVGLLHRSPRFFTLSMKLTSHTSEFLASLCSVMLTEALLPHWVDDNVDVLAARNSPGLPSKKDAVLLDDGSVAATRWLKEKQRSHRSRNIQSTGNDSIIDLTGQKENSACAPSVSACGESSRNDDVVDLT